jgi:hypothetical protein
MIGVLNPQVDGAFEIWVEIVRIPRTLDLKSRSFIESSKVRGFLVTC